MRGLSGVLGLVGEAEMKSTTTIKLLSVACVLAIATWVIRTGISSSGQLERTQKLLLRKPTDMLLSLKIRNGDVLVKWSKKKGEWTITDPVTARADLGKLERILAALDSLPKKEVISKIARKKRELSLKDYALSEPRARIALGYRRHTEELDIGAGSMLDNSLYVRFRSSDDVISTSTNILNSLPASLSDMRDRRLFHSNAERVMRLEIKNRAGGFIQLDKKEGQWHLLQPVSDRASNNRVVELLSILHSQEITQFVTDTNAHLEPYGLGSDEAAVEIAIWRQDKNSATRLMLGKEIESGEQVYAKLQGTDSIYTLKSDIARSFQLASDSLRDRRVFSGAAHDVDFCEISQNDTTVALRRQDDSWLVVKPAQWRADNEIADELVEALFALRIESFVEGAQTNLAQFNLDIPLCRLEVGSTNAPKSYAELIIGGIIPKKKTVYAQFRGAPRVFEISLKPIEQLGLIQLDPLIYRDRIVLSISPDSVTRISRTKDGEAQSVKRNDNEEWVTEADPPGKVISSTVDDVLLGLARLKTDRIVDNDARNADQYGLGEPGSSLTILLRGEEGLQKTLLLGHKYRTGSLYAMIKGQDMIFLISEETVEPLMKDLIE